MLPDYPEQSSPLRSFRNLPGCRLVCLTRLERPLETRLAFPREWEREGHSFQSLAWRQLAAEDRERSVREMAASESFVRHDVSTRKIGRAQMLRDARRGRSRPQPSHVPDVTKRAVVQDGRFVKLASRTGRGRFLETAERTLGGMGRIKAVCAGGEKKTTASHEISKLGHQAGQVLSGFSFKDIQSLIILRTMRRLAFPT